MNVLPVMNRQIYKSQNLTNNRQNSNYQTNLLNKSASDSVSFRGTVTPSTLTIEAAREMAHGMMKTVASEKARMEKLFEEFPQTLAEALKATEAGLLEKEYVYGQEGDYVRFNAPVIKTPDGFISRYLAYRSEKAPQNEEIAPGELCSVFETDSLKQQCTGASKRNGQIKDIRISTYKPEDFNMQYCFINPYARNTSNLHYSELKNPKYSRFPFVYYDYRRIWFDEKGKKSILSINLDGEGTIRYDANVIPLNN